MEAHVYIYGEVGKQVTLDSVLKEITPKATSYVVHIHSPGGDVFEGYAIYNALKNTGKEIEVRIEGVCASIAMSIASVASPGKRFANTKSSLMIHDPSFQNISGTESELRTAADLLKQIKSQFLTEWATKTGLSDQKLSEMYSQTTWMTPEQALELGFIDGVQESLKAVAYADFKKYNQMQDKKEIKGMIEKLSDAINKFLSPRAEAPTAKTETLKDGTVVVVPDDEDWVGKSVTTEDGAPLPPGVHELASGFTVTVDENGNVTEKTKVEAEPEDMETKKQLEEAQAKIKELESALEARNNAATTAEAKVVSLQAKMNTDVKKLADELERIKTTAIGDTNPPNKGNGNLPLNNGKHVLDPMQEFFRKTIIDK